MTLLANKKAVRKTQKRRGPTLRPNRASPGPHSGEGAGEITRAGLRESTGAGHLEQGAAAKQKGKSKNQTREAPKHPCRLASQEKEASEGASRLKPREFDLTSREFLPNSFGSEPPKRKAKVYAKHHRKTQDQRRHPKQKFAPEKFFKQRGGKRRRSGIKKARDAQPDTKKTQKKTDSNSPFEKGGKQTISPYIV